MKLIAISGGSKLIATDVLPVSKVLGRPDTPEPLHGCCCWLPSRNWMCAASLNDGSFVVLLIETSRAAYSVCWQLTTFPARSYAGENL